MSPILRRSLPLAAVSLALAACDPAAPPAPPTGPGTAAPSAPKPPTPHEKSTEKALPTAAPPAKAATSDELKALAKSDNAFALELWSKVREGKGNLAMSPLSIATALDMALAGAKGETATQMAGVLHVTGPVDRTLDVAGSLIAEYGAPDNKVTLRVANRLFGEKTFPFEKPYLARVESAFGAPLEPVDFKNGAEDGRKRINDWVAQQTKDRIKDLVPPGAVNGQTRLTLVNAVYFLGDWATPFEPAATKPEPFFVGKSAKKDVPTMHEMEKLHFAATDGVKVLELPYQNGALAMDFVLPDEVDGLDAVEARLTSAVFDKWMGAMAAHKVTVSLPKAEVAPAEALALAPTLAAMGMPLAFDRAKADFTGIANPPSPEDRLYVSAVFHKAFVKMDEKGTEAAAATALPMARAGAALEPEQPQEFKADHPYLFFLRDVRSGLVLFMGRVLDPQSK